MDGANGLNQLRQSSVMLVNAMARYVFNDRMPLQFNGDNLLNRKYFVLDDASNLFNLYYAPTLTLSFNYKFF